MTNPDHESPMGDADHAARPRMGRRQLLQTGGLTLSLGALLAACAKGEEGEPGRVGYAPAATPLPNVVVDDAVRLRTATSIEHTIVAVYAKLTELGALEADDQAFLDKLSAQHEKTAADVARLTKDAGGEPYECANTWYMERVVPPIFTNIAGDKDAEIAASDDPARDTIAVVNAMESMAAAMYQGMVESLTEPKLRAEVITFATRSARHAAATVIRATEAPAGYFNPELLGEAAPVAENGLFPLFALPTRFGSLAPTSLIIGAATEAGTRFTTPIETPADNSFVYAGQTCDA